MGVRNAGVLNQSVCWYAGPVISHRSQHCQYLTSESAPTIQTQCTVKVPDLSLVFDSVYLVYPDLAYWDALGYQDSDILATLTSKYQQFLWKYLFSFTFEIIFWFVVVLATIKCYTTVSTADLLHHSRHCRSFISVSSAGILHRSSPLVLHCRCFSIKGCFEALLIWYQKDSDILATPTPIYWQCRLQ